MSFPCRGSVYLLAVPFHTPRPSPNDAPPHRPAGEEIEQSRRGSCLRADATTGVAGEGCVLAEIRER